MIVLTFLCPQILLLKKEMINLYLMLCLLATADCTLDAFHHNIFQNMSTNGILPKVWHKNIQKHTFENLQFLSKIPRMTEWLERYKTQAQVFYRISRSKLNQQFGRTIIRKASGLVKMDGSK